MKMKWHYLLAIFFIFIILLCPVSSETKTITELQKIMVDSKWDVSYFTVNRINVTLGRFLGKDSFPSIFDKNWGKEGPPQVGSQTDYFGFCAETKIYVSKESEVHFKIGSDDYSELFIDGKLVLSIKEPSSIPLTPFQEKDRSYLLTAGFHNLTLRFYELEGDARCSFTTDPDVTRWFETRIVEREECRYIFLIEFIINTIHKFLIKI
jgi:hypothetical protein